MIKCLVHCVVTRDGKYVEFGPLELPSVRSSYNFYLSGIYLGRIVSSDDPVEAHQDGLIPTFYVDATELRSGRSASLRKEQDIVARFIERTEPVHGSIAATNLPFGPNHPYLRIVSPLDDF